jgi:outer membrane phospholipase A
MSLYDYTVLYMIYKKINFKKKKKKTKYKASLNNKVLREIKWKDQFYKE